MHVKNKSFIHLCVFILFLFTIIFSLTIPSFAFKTYTETFGDETYTVNEKWKETWDWAKTVYGGADSGEMIDLKEIVNFRASTNGTSTSPTTSAENARVAKNGIWSMVLSIYNAFETAGYLMVVLYFMIDLMDKTTHDNFTMEHLIRQFIKLFVAIFIIQNGIDILTYIFDISAAFTDSVSNAATNAFKDAAFSNNTNYSANKLREIADALNQGGIPGWLAAFGYKTTLLIPWLGFQIVKVIIWYMCWSRFIEIGLRASFAPIGMADMFSNGLQGSGFRYFKKLCAVILQGVFIIAIVTIVQSINAAFSYNDDLEFFSRFVILFAEIGLIKKSQSLANDLLGV